MTSDEPVLSSHATLTIVFSVYSGVANFIMACSYISLHMCVILWQTKFYAHNFSHFFSFAGSSKLSTN